jgi:hypothetical protein
MGMVHQIRVIAMVGGIYRAIAALAIPRDDPSSDKLTSTVLFLVLFLFLTGSCMHEDSDNQLTRVDSCDPSIVVLPGEQRTH